MCDWACIDGFGTHGFAEAPCTESSRGMCVGQDVGAPCLREEDCTIEFCVDGICSNGQRGAMCNDARDCVGWCDEASASCL